MYQHIILKWSIFLNLWSVLVCISSKISLRMVISVMPCYLLVLPVKTECLHLRIQEYRISSTNQIKLRDTAFSNHAAEQMHLAVAVCGTTRPLVDH